MTRPAAAALGIVFAAGVLYDAVPTHASATTAPSLAYAWGWNEFGQLGCADCSRYTGRTPRHVSGLTGVTAMAAGVLHSLALRSDGTVWAWGYNVGGSTPGTGICYIRPCVATPVQVTGLTAMTAIAGGDNFSLALKSDGTVWAWGDNGAGQFGNGSTTGSNTPVQVTGLTGMTAIAAGYKHSLALKSDGTVWAWGDNRTGELGNGTSSGPDNCLNGPCSLTPLEVGGLTGVTAVAGGATSAWR